MIIVAIPLLWSLCLFSQFIWPEWSLLSKDDHGGYGSSRTRALAPMVSTPTSVMLRRCCMWCSFPPQRISGLVSRAPSLPQPSKSNIYVAVVVVVVVVDDRGSNVVCIASAMADVMKRMSIEREVYTLSTTEMRGGVRGLHSLDGGILLFAFLYNITDYPTALGWWKQMA